MLALKSAKACTGLLAVIMILCVAATGFAAGNSQSDNSVAFPDSRLAKLPPPESDAPREKKPDAQPGTLEEVIAADHIDLKYAGIGYDFTSGSYRNGGTSGNETLNGGVQNGWGLQSEYGDLQFHKLENFAIVFDDAKECSYQQTSQNYSLAGGGSYTRTFNYWYGGQWLRAGISVGGVNNTFGIVPYAGIGVGLGMNYSTGLNSTNNTAFALTAPYGFGVQLFGYNELNGLIVDCYYKNYSWAWTFNDCQGGYIENPACYGIALKFALTGIGN